MEKFGISCTGSLQTVGYFKDKLRVEVRLYDTRKEFVRAQRKHGGPGSGDATTHCRDVAKADGTVATIYLCRDDLNINIVTHESIHAAVRVTHEVMGAVLSLDQFDKVALQEETICYIASEIADEIRRELHVIA